MFIFFFRFLHSLKQKVKNKARVEGSICEAYLVEETSTFASFYYPNHVEISNGQSESYFYGVLSNIIQVEFIGLPIMNLIPFQCKWFDNTTNIVTKAYNKYLIVQVKKSHRYNKTYDPFIFVKQVEQVYDTKYPKGHRGWLGVIKTIARSRIIDNTVRQIEHETPYQDNELL